MPVHFERILIAAATLLVLPASASPQQTGPTGLELAGLPALKFDSDEGIGYGAVVELYQYGDGTSEPYVWTLQPEVLLSTGGRRDLTLFIDLPHVLAEGWRVNGFLGIEKSLASPYYGVGNRTSYVASLEDPDGPNPYYYDFGELRRSAFFNLQRRVADTPLWALFGAGLVSTHIDPTPKDEGSTLYATEQGSDVRTYWTNYLRAGLIWDTRDRETGPRSGSWSEVVFHWVTPSLGADVEFTRWSVTDRRYYSLTDRIVFAHRFFLQGVDGDAPVHQLQLVQTSFKQADGLGGSKSVRGLPKNRYAGKGMLVWNAELRFHLFEFDMVGRHFYTALSTFLDQGRVWAEGIRLRELPLDLHRGYGAGLHLGMGENFLVSVDFAHSSETVLPFYIRLGYLF